MSVLAKLMGNSRQAVSQSRNAWRWFRARIRQEVVILNSGRPEVVGDRAVSIGIELVDRWKKTLEGMERTSGRGRRYDLDPKKWAEFLNVKYDGGTLIEVFAAFICGNIEALKDRLRGEKRLTWARCENLVNKWISPFVNRRVKKRNEELAEIQFYS